MKTTLFRTRRGVIALPVERYSEKRIHEFDQAEAQLEKVLRRKKKRVPAAARASRRRRP